MSGVPYTVAIGLAAVLLWAAVTKLRRPHSARASFEAIGLPAPALLARAVPLVEGAVAATLVVAPGTGGRLALGLLALFTVALGRAARRGVACACFGRASAAEPASVAGLVRNAGLMVAAVVASAAAGPRAPGLAGVILVTTAGLIGVVGLALLDLRLRIGRVWSNTLAGEPTGSATP